MLIIIIEHVCNIHIYNVAQQKTLSHKKNSKMLCNINLFRNIKTGDIYIVLKIRNNLSIKHFAELFMNKVILMSILSLNKINQNKINNKFVRVFFHGSI